MTMVKKKRFNTSFKKGASPSSKGLSSLTNLLSKKRFVEGIPAAVEMTQKYPASGFAWKSLGLFLMQAGRFQEALGPMEQAIALLPQESEPLRNMAFILRQLNRLDDAVHYFRQVVALNPQDFEGYSNLGAALREAKQYHESRKCFEQALILRPDFVEARINLGSLLLDMGELRDAAVHFKRSLEAGRHLAEIYYNLGVLHTAAGDIMQAITAYRDALAGKPDYAEALSNLGAILMGRGQLEEAEKLLRKAIGIKPDYAEAFNNLGGTLQHQGKSSEAEWCYRQALAINPSYALAFSNLLFTLNYHPDRTAEEIFAAYQEYDARFGLPLRAEWLPHTNAFAADRRLKIGYVSPDFRLHSCRHFLEPLLANHTKDQVEVFAYAELQYEDDMTIKYKGYTDHWISTIGIDDAALAEKIRTDSIDILVDLAGHTAYNRLGVFARKPAPVSVTWLGYGYTTGLYAIDYILTDTTSAPEGSEHLFSESPWRMQTPGYVYRPAEGMGEVSGLPALERGSITFGTLTRAVRINHHTVKAWSEILKRVSGSRLIVNSQDFCEVPAKERLAEQFASCGVSRDRLEIGFHSPPWDTLRQIDITLDCFPHNSGTTLFESLYMGVPFITLAGRPSVGRIGSSILEGVGHPEWIATSQEAYIEKAVALASDLAKLAAIRQKLRNEMELSLLMDETSFAGKVEQAYRHMWHKWCQTKNTAAMNDEEVALNLQKALAYHSNGQLQEAEYLYRTILKAAPAHPEVNHNLGLLALQHNQIEAGLSYFKTALKTLPQQGRYWQSYIYALIIAGKHDLAKQTADQGIGFGIPKVLLDLEGLYHRVASINPDDSDIKYRLGNILLHKGCLNEAEAAYRDALKLNPNHTEACNNLGGILKISGKFVEAEDCLRRVIVLKPQYVDAYNNLGLILKDKGALIEALDRFRQALSMKPDFVDAQQNLSTILAYLSHYDGVVEESNIALQLNPDIQHLWEQRLYAFSYHPDLSAEEIFAEFVRWGDRFPVPSVDFSGHNHTPGRRLRVGYVSPDFRRHTSRFYFMPLFANHDKAQVELFAYSNVNIEDDYTEKFKGVFDHWRNIRGLSKEDAAAMIRADGIDILVDCCNHMMDDRLDIFTLKPAPIQVTWLGAAWTTGLPMVDYVLFDPYIAPEGTLTREEIIRLPHFFVAYQPPEETAEVQEPPCLKNGCITFGYSGRTERLNHKTFRVWGELLRQVPDSRLILDYKPFSDPPTQEHYRRFMAEQGMDPDRVIMRKSENIFEGLGDIDILLDCFPHSGGTMLFDALWMGVPALTLASRPPVGRIGTSLMTNLGLPEWVAQTEEEYIAKAVNFAAQPQLLSELRRTMRQRMQGSPVMDGKGFAQGVEQAYRQIWRRWVKETD